MVKKEKIVNKNFFDLFSRARWTYFVIGIVFVIIGYSQDGFNFSNSFFGAGVVVLIAGLLLIILNRVLKKKW